jgi:hypothetical protein
MNLLQTLATHGTSLPEPVALLFVGMLMISLGSLGRRSLSLAKVPKQAGKN